MSPSGGSSRRCSSTPARREEDRDQGHAFTFEFPWGFGLPAAPLRGKRASGQRVRSRSPDNTTNGAFSTIANKFGQAMSCRRRSQSRVGSKKKETDKGVSQESEDPTPQPLLSVGDTGAWQSASAESAVVEQAPSLGGVPSAFFKILLDSGPALPAPVASPELQQKLLFGTESIMPRHVPEGAAGRAAKHDLPSEPGISSSQRLSIGIGQQTKRPSSCRGLAPCSSSSPQEKHTSRIRGCSAVVRRHGCQPMQDKVLLTPCVSLGPLHTRDSLEGFSPKARWRLWQAPSV